MKNIIYYFTGTGNSLYAAKHIASVLPECAIISMSAQEIPLPDETTARIGFVYPVYAGGLPLMVRRFVETLPLPPQAYLFGVATHGGHLLGGTRDLGALIESRGLHLDYAADVKMPGNFLLLYGRMETSEELLASAESMLPAIAEAILARAVLPARRPSAAIRKVHDSFMAKVPSTAMNFRNTDACTGCGLCAALCPAGNITLTAGRPAFGSHCESCMACLQYCPNRAIDAGEDVLHRKRYHHPHITLQEMLDRNR